MISLLKKILMSPQDLPDIPDSDFLPIATCAVLLEMAAADEQFDDSERDHIIKALRARFELSNEDAEALLDASQAEREDSVDIWHFTNHINQRCSREDRISIIEEVWRVVYADGTLDAHEDYLAHKLAKLLRLPHSALIKAKVRVLDESR